MNTRDTSDIDGEAALQSAMLKRAFELAFDAEARDVFDVQRRTDQTDLANETADRDVNRPKRFLTNDDDGLGNSRKDSKRRKREFVSQLQFLLQTNAAYRELYDDAQRKIIVAERATETALDMVERLIAEADNAITRAENRTQYVDAEPVLMDMEGRVWTAGGELISDDIAARIEWRGDEMKREQYLTLRENRDALTDERDGILVFQTDILGRARDRMHSDNDPPKPDDIKDTIKDIDTEMPDRVKAIMDDQQIALTASPTAAPLPKLGG